MATYRVACDFNCFEIEADSDDEAVELARDELVSEIDPDDESQCGWHEWHLYRLGSNSTAEGVDIIEFWINPPEPDCEEGQEHEWEAPWELLGGLKENPGVWGHGGGVINYEVCLKCGCRRCTDTWHEVKPGTIVTKVDYEEGWLADQSEG